MAEDAANVRVFCRVRPPNERERGVATSTLSGAAGLLAYTSAATAMAPFLKKCVSVPSSEAAPQTVFLHSKHGVARTFTFDRVFDESASQDDVFVAVGAPITQACLEGYNGTIFAYGQTGSGKTFTMQGPDDALDTDRHSLSGQELELRGLVPRVFDYLFQNVVAKDRGATVQHTFACSFLEIYNERVYDLLGGGGSANDGAGLQLRENGRKGVHVEGLIESVVTNAQEAARLMTRGAQNRRVGQTSMNRESSRSHSVFILQLQSKEVSAEGTKIRSSRFNLVDLAGSERQRSTEAAGERLKEANSINKSLSALGNVIMGLSEQSAGKNRHVHYRDSKLTFLLKDSLGGNSKTFMIATVSPADDSAFETLSTLKFAQRAKMIQNNAVINEDSTGSVLYLQEEIQKLRRQLRQAHHKIARGLPGSSLLSQDSEVGSAVVDAEEALSQQLSPQCDPAVDGRFRELEEAFASTIEKNDRLQRSCEYLQLREENFQALCAEMKRSLAHLKLLLCMRGGKGGLPAASSSGDTEMLEYEPSADAIEWRIKYEEMEERFLELQDELQRTRLPSDTGKLSRQTDGDVENLNIMLLALTKQLAFVVRDKHDLQDRLLQHGVDATGDRDATSKQEAEHEDFSARLEEALKQQANEYQSKMEALTAINTSLEEKATETSYELLEIKEREASWTIQHNDRMKELADTRSALQRSEDMQSSTQRRLVQEQQQVADLQVQLERTREAIRLEFESTLADTNTASQELQALNTSLQDDVEKLKARLKQSEQREEEAQAVISDLKLKVNHSEEANRTAKAQLAVAQDATKELEVQTAEKLQRLSTELDARTSKAEEAGLEHKRLMEEQQAAMDALQREFMEHKDESATKLADEKRQAEVGRVSAQEEAKRLHSDITKLEQEKETMESEKTSLSSRFEELTATVNELQTRKSELEQTCEKQEAELARREDSIKKSTEKAQALQQQVTAQKEEAEALRNDLALAQEAARQAAADHRHEVEELNKSHEAKLASVHKSADESIEALRSDVSKLELRVHEKQTEVDKLNGQTDELVAKCTQQSEDLTRKSEAHATATERVASLEKDVARRVQELNEKSESLKTVESQLTDLTSTSEQKMEELNQELAAKSDAMESVSAKLKHTSSELEATQQELKSALSDREEHTRSLLEQLSELRGKLREAEGVAATQGDEMEKHKAIQASLDADLRKLEVERLALAECLETERKSKDAVELQLQEAHKKWQSERDELTRTFEASTAALEKRVADLTLNEEKLSTQKHELEQDVKSLKASVDDGEEQICTLESRIDSQSAKFSTTRAKLEETVAELQSSAAQQEAEFKQKLSALSDRDGVIQTLQDELRSKEETWDGKVKTYEAELESTRSRVEELDWQMAEKKALLGKEQARFESEKQALQLQLDKDQEAVTEQTQRTLELEREVKQLRVAVADKDEELKRAKETLVDMEGRLEISVATAKDAMTEEKQLEVKKLTETLAEMESKHRALVEENEALKQKEEAAESKLEAERKTLEDRKPAARPVARDPKAKKLSEDETKRQFLHEKVKLQREVQALTRKLESVSKENEKLVGHHNARQKIQHHAKVKEENNRLLEQVRKLTDNNFKMHSRLERLQAVLKEKENIDVEPRSNTSSSVGSASGNTPTANSFSTSKVRRSSATSASIGSATAARAAARVATRVTGPRTGTATRVPARTRPASNLPGTPKPAKRPRSRFE